MRTPRAKELLCGGIVESSQRPRASARPPSLGRCRGVGQLQCRELDKNGEASYSRREHFLRRRLPTPGVMDVSIRVDQEHRPLGTNPAIGLVQLRDLLVFIDQQGEREFMLVPKSLMRPAARVVYSQYDRVASFRERPLVAEFAQLFSTNTGVVGGIKHQHN